ncbi:MAG: hypothetical protein Kow0054_02930 [Deferrisoma sp.]
MTPLAPGPEDCPPAEDQDRVEPRRTRERFTTNLENCCGRRVGDWFRPGASAAPFPPRLRMPLPARQVGTPAAEVPEVPKHAKPGGARRREGPHPALHQPPTRWLP